MSVKTRTGEPEGGTSRVIYRKKRGLLTKATLPILARGDTKILRKIRRARKVVSRWSTRRPKIIKKKDTTGGW